MTGQETNMVTMWHFWMQRDPEFQKCFFWRSVQCRSAAGSSEVHAEGGGDIAQCTSGREALLRPTFDALLLRAFRGRQTSTTQWSSLFRKHSLASGPSLTQQSNRAKKLSRNDYDRNIIYIISLYIYNTTTYLYHTHIYIFEPCYIWLPLTTDWTLSCARLVVQHLDDRKLLVRSKPGEVGAQASEKFRPQGSVNRRTSSRLLIKSQL